MTIEEKARAYDEALKKIQPLYKQAKKEDNPIWSTYEHLFPELRESEDERMLKKLIEGFKNYIRDIRYFNDIDVLNILNFLEKQKNKKFAMIQWTGKNLKEVIDFTGKSQKFGEWFKSWEEYEKYVYSHGNILKLFKEDGSHYEVPVGAWIVKTPDGYNIPSRFRFIRKPAEWSEEDENMLTGIIERGSSQIPFYELALRKEQLEWLMNKFKFLHSQPRDYAITFWTYLDEHKPEGKMCLSNGECADIEKAFIEHDWGKILRYAKKYLSSKELIEGDRA